MEKKLVVRIVSSNIRFANAADGSNDWNCRRQLWSQMINSFSPWVVGTQEGRQPQLEDAASLLAPLKLVDQHRDWIEERMYPCLFYNSQVLELQRSGDAWLSQTPQVAGSKSFDSAFPRLCTWMQVLVKQTQQKLFFINTHLDHVLNDTREQQIQVLLDTLERENSESLPVILTGDFNEGPQGKVRSLINQRQPQLIDPWLKLGHDEQTSHHKFCGQNENGARIDWVLINKELYARSIVLDQGHEGGLWPSDHFIVKAEIEI